MLHNPKQEKRRSCPPGNPAHTAIPAVFIPLTPDISVAAQLVESDFERAAALGFRSIINNRPDGEIEGQLPATEAEKATHAAGLEYAFQPVTCLQAIDADIINEFRYLIDSMPGPILAYCRTGTRCTTIWAQAVAGRMEVDEILQRALKGGYDLEVIRPELEDLAFRKPDSRSDSHESAELLTI